MGTQPFEGGDTFATFRDLLGKAQREIAALENEYVLKASPTELEEYYVSKVTVSPLFLDVDNYYIESQKGTRIDVSHHFDRVVSPGRSAFIRGTTLHIAIPYSGDPKLWRLRPSRRSLSGYPELEIREDVVLFACRFADDSANPESLRSEIQSNIKSLAEAVANLRLDVDSHNQSAPQEVRSAIVRKREKAQSVVGTVAALGIPIKQHSQPMTFTVPTKRRQSPVTRPPVSTEKFTPEPTLDQKEYEHILGVLRSMSLVIERSPGAFASLNEEGIRTHFLLQLNGHYEGTATGETFNALGKTDILIRVEGRNIFIAECKFWNGSKSFSNAIDQLLGYLSWRDSKCALIIFNKAKNSSDVRQKMHEAMTSRQEHRKTISHNSEGDPRYIFVKPTDPGREIQISTMLFDVPTA